MVGRGLAWNLQALVVLHKHTLLAIPSNRLLMHEQSLFDDIFETSLAVHQKIKRETMYPPLAIVEHEI